MAHMYKILLYGFYFLILNEAIINGTAKPIKYLIAFSTVIRNS